MPDMTDPDAQTDREANWKIVPAEPTHGMVCAGTEARWRSAVRDANNVREIYAAMLYAAPALENGPAGLADANSKSPSPSSQSERIAVLEAAGRKALRFIEHTESERGITFDSGDTLRAALAPLGEE